MDSSLYDLDFCGKFGNFKKDSLVSCNIYPNFYFKVKKVTILQTSFNSFGFNYILEFCGKIVDGASVEDTSLSGNFVYVSSSTISLL
ncbi:MAG: hypothetical protein PUB96_00690 [Helicobacteraceae bacterium]|nr:hypothetical protein [Helicobacteraceae bacterium]